MKRLCLAVSLLAACSAPIAQEAMPLDPLLRCSANAMRIYDLPPRIAIILGCDKEIAALENWALSFIEQTGMTLQDVELLIGESAAN